MRSLLEKLRNRNWLKSASCWMFAGREKKMSLLETWVATRSGQNPQGDAGAASVFRCHTVPRPLCRSHTRQANAACRFYGASFDVRVDAGFTWLWPDGGPALT